MTWIIDDSGTHWVDMPQKNKWKSPRALRFADLKVGDQLVLLPTKDWYRGISQYVIVTDMWFDPVAGQDDEMKGRMVGYAQIRPDGSTGRKSSTTLRGLASQRYKYSDIDYMGLCKSRNEVIGKGVVVGIGLKCKIRD